MKRTILIITLFALTFGISSAQQVPQFSQNMFNKLANNPGSAGSGQAICASTLHRSQWMGFDGAPITLNLSVDAPIPAIYGGLGLNIMTDKIGQSDDLSLQLSYAYRTELGEGQLGIGFAVGMFQSRLNGNEFFPADGSDPYIPQGEESGSVMDFGGGIYYNTQDVYLGLSTLHITEPEIEETYMSRSRHYFLLAGFHHELNPIVSLNPSIYLKSDGTTSQLDINTNIIYNNRIWGGVSYRMADPSFFKPELVILTGMNINEDLKFGLAYDVVLSNIGNNSIEFMLGYCFKVDYDKPVKSYKNPRYL
jgi:type IX secretion system PorP/SprF family membrane protein